MPIHKKNKGRKREEKYYPYRLTHHNLGQYIHVLNFIC